MISDSVGNIDFPTLGDLLDGWITAHCRVPQGFQRRQPFRQYDWQFWCTANHYRVRKDAVWTPEQPLLNQAFTYRRSQIIAPQKTGKGPWAACIISAEAVGPTIFGGWAKAGDMYRCSDNGCSCGWEWQYEAGEPKGIRHPSPSIQLTARSQEQAEQNMYNHLTAMVVNGPLKHLLLRREGFMRIVGQSLDTSDYDRIDVVTSASSRLGNPISFAVQDESGTYTTSNKMRKVVDDQRRGAAGMGGRTMETSNAWDPSEESVAQATFESISDDIFRFFRQPPANLRYSLKTDRHKIHSYVYEGSTHVNLDSIEAEAAELVQRDSAQAERFFGNRIVAGGGTWLPDGLWSSKNREWLPNPEAGTMVCGGFDGSENNDFTCIKLETLEGLIFTPRYGPDRSPTIWNPADWGGRIPRGEVRAAWAEITERYKVNRVYCDPGFHDESSWESEIEAWASAYGEEMFVQWPTNKLERMYPAIRRFESDLVEKKITHDGCLITTSHVRNVRKIAKGADRYTLGKPAQHQKIDAAVTSVLAHEAAADQRSAGWEPPRRKWINFS